MYAGHNNSSFLPNHCFFDLFCVFSKVVDIFMIFLRLGKRSYIARCRHSESCASLWWTASWNHQKPTVDGSEIRRSPHGMHKTL